MLKFDILVTTAFLIPFGTAQEVQTATAPPTTDSIKVQWAPDATEPIQQAINSGATHIVIPNAEKDWVVRPLHLASHQTITFEPGVVVLAQKGAFHKIDDCLFVGSGVRDVTLIGPGATLRMRKADYQAPGYKKSQWRHCILLKNGCEDVTIDGLTLEQSGGDGIYVGANFWKQPPARHVRILNVTCKDNLRQGISVTSGVDLRIEHCKILNTRGQNPQAGIDIEPAVPTFRIEQIVVSDCEMIDNAGSGVLIALHHMTEESRPVSIDFDRCIVRNSGQAGIRIKKTSAKGSIKFRGCNVYDSGDRKDASVPIVQYEQCKWYKKDQIIREE